MELPAIKLPQIVLPFDIPVLLHPPVDHFIIALPLIILLLEIVNLVIKKRAIGVTSFFLLILTVVAAAAAYFTGSVDGKEAFPLLNEAAQGELKAHKLFGTYLMLASAIVLVFKLLSVMIQKGLMKTLYLLILILFVAGILKQGKEGGDLVYKYGVNVEKVQELDSELDDLKEELEELQAVDKPLKAEEKEAVVTVEKTKLPEKTVEAVDETTEKAVEEKTEAAPVPAPAETETIETPVETVEEKVSEVKEKVEASLEKAESEVEVVPAVEAAQPEVATH
jgi:uncharacterized membrane protein